ncbi:MAG: tRNA-specific adenosine deaminase [Gammaproteobacteria bacterium]|nr:tRNA-specific adenosine deaminase [Gammaproteobacteria bacterium]|tara:strand:- start:3218 stop:3667 length:450 start_codon:yes stop_codon:yes gene_type:complete
MNNDFYMEKCIKLAKLGMSLGEVPVGAAIIIDNKIISESYSSSIMLNDPTAHAEIIAIRNASKAVNNYRILNSFLYTTLEPCIMCLGAISEARIKKIIYGAKSEDNIELSDKILILKKHFKLDHIPEIIGGIREDECSALLKGFFSKKR